MFCKVKGMVFLFFLSLVFLFFPEVARASVYDGFLDEAASENLWFYEDENNIANYNEAAGLIEINAANSDEEADMISKYCFSGDFDVKMRYQDWSLNAAMSSDENLSPAHIGLAVTTLESYYLMENDQDPQDFIYLMRMWNYLDGKDYYFATAIFGGVMEGAGAQPTTETEGFLRMFRQDGRVYISSYSFDHQSWYTWEAFGNKFTDPVVIGAIAYSGETPLLKGGFQVAADYISIESEGMTPIPEPATFFLLAAGVLGIATTMTRRK